MNRRASVASDLAVVGVLLSVVVGLLLLAVGCSRNQAESAPAHGVSYLLEWKKSKVQEVGGSGWEVTNDLGYRVHVTHGYLATRSLELIPCNPVPPPPISLLEKIDNSIGPRPAYAGHSAIADPSATKNAEVESLIGPQSHYAATLYPGPQKYCQAHYLIARADPGAIGLPKEVDMVDQSLRLEGWYRPPGETQEKPFTVVTAVANGRLFDLPRSQAKDFALDTADESAVVVVSRNLDTIFDHVDFANMPDKRIGREILQNLINGTELELRVNHGS